MTIIQTHTPSINRLWVKYGLLSLIVSALVFIVPEFAYAQTSPMGYVVCSVVGIIYGNLGRGLAVLAVIVVGIGATLGKVSWGLALTVAVGIGTVFGAVPLVAFLITPADNSICYGVAGIA